MKSEKQISASISGKRARRLRKEIKITLRQYLSREEVIQKLSQFDTDCSDELVVSFNVFLSQPSGNRVVQLWKFVCIEYEESSFLGFICLRLNSS
jgi:hypothetical protein